MIAIHKQPLSLVTEQVFSPRGAARKLLTIQNQAGYPCLWYEIEQYTDPSMWNEIHIALVGTGGGPPHWPYVDTTQQDGMVWHWYGRCVGP
ncbi:DUF7352 domain-containing protein [Nocardia fluminea]